MRIQEGEGKVAFPRYKNIFFIYPTPPSFSSSSFIFIGFNQIDRLDRWPVSPPLRFWPNLNLFGLSDILYNLSIWWKEEVEEEEEEEEGNRWYAVAMTAAAAAADS